MSHRTGLLLALRRLVPLLALLAFAVAAMLTGFLLGRRPPPPPVRRLEVTVVDVGHGEASWIRTPTGRFVLIGGGPPDGGQAVIASLRAAGAQTIDLLVLPYPYEEAIGGIPEVLRSFGVRRVIEPGYPPPEKAPLNQIQKEVRDLMHAARIPVQFARAGQRYEVGDGTRIEALAPQEPFVAGTPTSANNSIVLRVQYGEVAFLWTGGLERDGEAALLSRVTDLRADWLRVARFGTREATSPEFLRRAMPSVAVLSVGETNSGGYPHRETRERLEAAGARIFSTSASGSLMFSTDGVRLFAPGVASDD